MNEEVGEDKDIKEDESDDNSIKDIDFDDSSNEKNDDNWFNHYMDYDLDNNNGP